MRTHVDVLRSLARAVKQIDGIQTLEISNLDLFFIETARENLVKVIRANGYSLSEGSYRLHKEGKKKPSTGKG